MNRSIIKKFVTGGIAAVLSVGIMLPASASAAAPAESKAYKHQLVQQILKEQGWIGIKKFQWIIQKPVVKPQPEKPSVPETNTPSTPSKPSVPSKPSDEAGQSDFASQVVSLVNKERAKAGLKALTVHGKLTTMALDKAKDMNNNKYFSHTSPTYGSPFEMMKSYGISYKYAGENIAMGQRTPEEVMKSWMNSEGHRKNIMSPNFTMIGVGYYNGYWVQEFISQ
ncbi:CAP domain-containing protein [Paenibacillus dakarensis]|uniref:CAP domain-containing protein n=1 Tax=Paenibacillus dakarensis TaxID=1527293 RepID=UPI0006D5332F|nr:CAP domain-containing protein [Paenibacillus dakarensis]